jgi:hypothetical protein
MKYRIVMNTYENLEIWYLIERQASTNTEWSSNGSVRYDKEKDAEDVILATIENSKGKVITSSVILQEYE